MFVLGDNEGIVLRAQVNLLKTLKCQRATFKCPLPQLLKRKGGRERRGEPHKCLYSVKFAYTSLKSCPLSQTLKYSAPFFYILPYLHAHIVNNIFVTRRHSKMRQLLLPRIDSLEINGCYR